MSWQARPAIREDIGLLLGLNGPTGSGKTYSALRMARGLAGDDRFVVIDTEHRRALIYADEFKFDWVGFDPPYSPFRYWEAIDAQIKAGYRTIVVDSMSHEYAGEGGITDMHDDVVDKMVERGMERQGAKDWELRAAYTWPAWNGPKQEHKKLMSKLIALPTGHHLILCFRAEPKLAMTEKDGKKSIEAKVGATGRDGWFPICEKGVPFELLVSLLMLPEKPGAPLPIKCPEKLRGFFPPDKPIGEECGRNLLQWAKGGQVASTRSPAPREAVAPVGIEAPKAASTQPPPVHTDRRSALITEANDLKAGMPTKDFLDLCATFFDGQRTGAAISTAPPEKLEAFVDELRKRKGAAA